MLRPLTKKIDLTALISNYKYMKSVCPNSGVMVVVKSNAYGHGLLRISKSLFEADGFCVACISEAILMRRSGISQKILVLQGCYSESEIKNAQEYNLSLVCHNEEQLDWIKRTKGKNLEIWAKFDTGMNRLGFPVQDHERIMQTLLELPSLETPPVIMSHFASADAEDDSYNQYQAEKFREIYQLYRSHGVQFSIANSAAALRHPEFQYDQVRSGIAIYGYAPENTGNHHRGKLTPVMSLNAPIIAIKEVKKGDRIGYESKYVCKKSMRVGVVAIGYGDGYLRSANSETMVWINGRLHYLIGRVSMDMIQVDLEDAKVQVGDEVELWGKNLLVSQVAGSHKTIPYELLCSVSSAETVLE